jgi:hypothetical protein
MGIEEAKDGAVRPGIVGVVVRDGLFGLFGAASQERIDDRHSRRARSDLDRLEIAP